MTLALPELLKNVFNFLAKDNAEGCKSTRSQPAANRSNITGLNAT